MILLRILGGLFLAVGAIGLFVPLWPTTIFWILAALCFARSSPAAQSWIYARPTIGPMIENFVERGTLNPSAKRAAILGILIGAGVTVFALHRSLTALAICAAVFPALLLFIATRPNT